ncbi:hypothetical protein T4A_8471, partial [Trichinella pseudospiralis]
MYLDCQSKKVIQLKEQVLFNTKMYNVGFLHSSSEQLPIPGKATSSGQSTPSHDAVPGLTIPKKDGSKHIPSDALPLPSGQKDGSGSSSPTHTN